MLELTITLNGDEIDAICSELLIPKSAVVRTQCLVTFRRSDAPDEVQLPAEPAECACGGDLGHPPYDLCSPDDLGHTSATEPGWKPGSQF